jgi:hypothetical protein
MANETVGLGANKYDRIYIHNSREIMRMLPEGSYTGVNREEMNIDINFKIIRTKTCSITN